MSVASRLHQPPLISEHDTWISLDPVIGCPADCGYCYLGTLGLRARKPVLRTDRGSVGSRLREYVFGRRSELIDPDSDRTPICIGNYTDMFMTGANRRLAVELLDQITGILPPRLIVFITKAALDRQTVSAIDKFGWPVLWFFSQSFAFARKGRLELGRVADFDSTVRNAEMVATTTNQQAAHFWRPFVRELVPPIGERPRIIERMKRAGMRCSVVIGMAHGPGTPVSDPRLRNEIPSAVAEDPVGSEIIDRASWRDVRDIAQEMQYPVYRHTSCAIALVDSQPEQLGTWGGDAARERCLPCVCPLLQRGRCGTRRDAAHDPNHMQAFAVEIAKFLDLDEDKVECDIARRLIRVDVSVSEFDYNAILHASSGRYSIAARSVEAQKAWQGSFVTMYSKKRE